MKFEVLKQSHVKRNIIIGVIVVLIISAIILNFTRAKYRVTESIPLVNGIINYSLDDLNVVAIVVNGESVDTMPEGNYELLDTSYCTIDGEDANVTLSWDRATQTLSVIPFTTRGTKCYLEFATATTRPVHTILLGTIYVNLDEPDFNNTSCTNGSNNGGNCGEETVGIYEETTSNGTTYYWRGNVDNNYLVFAGIYWRIIRINEDGTLRIIYSGEKSKVDAAGASTVLANGYDDSSTQYTQIQTGIFNRSWNASEYVGYRYTTGSQRPNNTNTGTDSTIKGILDGWYEGNLQSYDSRIASGGSAGFCNDREMASGYTWSSTGSDIYYAAYERIYTNRKPSFECSNSNDLYMTKIGLITADEAAYAGGRYGYNESSNYGYYLCTENYYWTMSPYSYSNGSIVFRVNNSGEISSFYVDGMSTREYGVRPVISLSTNNTITGTGTISDPYIVL